MDQAKQDLSVAELAKHNLLKSSENELNQQKAVVAMEVALTAAEASGSVHAIAIAKPTLAASQQEF